MKRLLWTILVLLAFTMAVQGQDRLTMSKQLLKQDKAEEAIAILKSVVKVDPGNSEAFLVLGRAYLKVGKPDSAEIMGKSNLQINDKKPDGYILVAQAFLKQNKVDDAYAILKKGLKEIPNNTLLLNELGFVNLANDSLNEAIVSFSQAIQIEPKNAVAYRGLGETYLKQGGAESVAINYFLESIKADSSQTDLKYRVAKLYYNDRRFNEAADMYNSILSMNPNDDTAALELGQLYFLARQFGNSAKILGPYAERHPKDLDTWLMYLEALYNARQHSDATAAAEHVLKSQPKSAKAQRLAAKSYYWLRNYDKAIHHYSALNKIDTLSADDAKSWGKAYYYSKNDSMATVYFEKSLAKDSTQSDIYADLGAAYMRMKRFDKAANYFKKKFTEDSTSASAYVNYALSMEVLQKWDAARIALRKVLQINPNYIQGHYHLGYCLSQMDSIPSAMRAYETFVGLADTLQSKYKNELFSAYRYMAVVHLSNKKYPQAEAALTKVVALKPNDWEMHLWLAQTLHALNKKDEAKKEYQKVLRIDPNNKDAKKGLDMLELY